LALDAFQSLKEQHPDDLEILAAIESAKLELIDCVDYIELDRNLKTQDSIAPLVILSKPEHTRRNSYVFLYKRIYLVNLNAVHDTGIKQNT